MQRVLVIIFHTEAIIVRMGNSKEKIISEIPGHKCLVKNVKVVVDRLQCICVPLFSSWKLQTLVYFARRSSEKMLVISKYTVVLLVGDICFGFYEV